jgi:phage terminase large subunit-like protein
MPDPTPPNVPDSDVLNAFRYWKPEVQERALDLLKQREHAPWRPFYCPDKHCNGQPHVVAEGMKAECTSKAGYHIWQPASEALNIWECEECATKGTPINEEWLWPHARWDQRPPRWSDDWLYWFLSGGRGSGKTRTGAEVTHRVTDRTPRIILIAPTGPDLRETMVEGISGLQATAPPDKMPTWEPSKKKLTWPNGCIAQGFSAEEPDRLRGPQSGFIWCDEPAFYPDTQSVWDNMLFGLRVKGVKGFSPKVVATTTPKPTKWMKATLADAHTVVHRVSSYANIGNLDDIYRKVILPKYEGTRLGQQELHGELLEDVEGALWQWEMIQWIEDAPQLQRIVVAVDPAGSVNKDSDETGIIVVGIGFDKNLYVLADLTGTYSPAKWADKSVAAHEDYSADAIVAEKNYGGDMVRNTLENAKVPTAIRPRVLPVNSRRGKALRAEPVVALYEKQRVFHVGRRGDLLALEEEQTSWVPGEGASPNRVDALVHGITELAKEILPAAVANPNDLRGRYVSSTGADRHLRLIRGA